MYGYLVDAGGIEYRNEFLKALGLIASRTLFTIPQFDYNNLAVMISPKQAYGEYRAEEIRSLSRAARAGWYVARVPLDTYSVIAGARAGTKADKDILRGAVDRGELETGSLDMGNLGRYVSPDHLLLHDHTALGLKDPRFNRDLHAFYRELDNLAATAEAEEAAFESDVEHSAADQASDDNDEVI